MDKEKLLIFAVLGTFFTASAFGVSYNPGVDSPVNKSYNSTVDSVSVNEEYFNYSVQSNELTVTGEKVIPSNTYPVSVDLAGNSSDEFSIDVPEYNNYQVEPSQINDSLSIGSSGQLETINITGDGNSIAEADLSLSGKISDFVTLLDNDKFIPTDSTRPVNLVYDVPRSQVFGNYTGNLTVSTGQKTENVSLDLELVDNINPVVESSNVQGLMATNSETFSWTVSDNLQVLNGSVKVFREEERVVNVSTGRTEMVNVSVDQAYLSRSEGNDAVWTYGFEDSSDIGSYFVNASFSDASNNTVEKSYGFSVDGLDSVNVLNSDFRFEDSRPRNSDNPSRVVERSVFEKSSDKDLTLSVQNSFTVSGNNSVNIGIRREDTTNPATLYKNGSTEGNITVTEPGTYLLTVYSNDAGFSYSGTLELTPVPQHVEIDNTIEFSGSFVDPEYPPLPENRSLGSFKGEMNFITNDNGVPTGLEYKGTQTDISDCKGVDSWGDCIPGYTLGEIPEINKQNQRLQTQANIMKFVGVSAVFWTIFVFLNNLAKGTRFTMKRVPESKIGEEWNSISQVEV